ncbi:hypothetical protein [Teredinibacter turnerae]|uniref:hypothetical protein n=1 Tax=Teredinibacter turnerae TaxID=2426 RepID=UPI00037FBDD0|nr:hypothetical protein [Teredinibacter turnerae]
MFDFATVPILPLLISTILMVLPLTSARVESYLISGKILVGYYFCSIIGFFVWGAAEISYVFDGYNGLSGSSFSAASLLLLYSLHAKKVFVGKIG